MNKLGRILSLAIMALVFTQSPAGDSIRVLFVGNSLSYYNNLPAMVESIDESSRPKSKMTVEMLASGGASIRDHLAAGHLAEILAKSRFDVVILQELGGFPNCPADFRGCTDSPAAISEAVALVRASGARPILFGTWQSTPESQKALSAATRAMASRLHVEVADVGAALLSAQTSSDFKVLNESGHPLPIGSWLAAIVIERAITMTDVPPRRPSPACGPDWTRQSPSEKSLASRQAQPPMKCFPISGVDFNKLRFVANGL